MRRLNPKARTRPPRSAGSPRESAETESVAAPMPLRPGRAILWTPRREVGMTTLQTYPALDTLRVAEAMHPGLISCSPDTPLRAVARMMATYRVHAILVTAHGAEQLPGGGVWGIISDTDLLRAAQNGDLDKEASRVLASARVLTVTTG